MTPKSTPGSQSEPPKTLKIGLDFGTPAYWFFPVVGIIYAAGFLIVFSFSKSFGMDAAELFQGKYIHIGSLFVMAAIVIVLPVSWLFQLRRMKEVTNRHPFAIFGGVLVYVLMLATFYVIVAFTERGFFHENAPLILFNFFPPLGFSLL